jgi:hypothetical protein
MLALSDKAAKEIEGILSAPTMPPGAGMRIAGNAPTVGARGAEDLQISVAEAPRPADR